MRSRDITRSCTSKRDLGRHGMDFNSEYKDGHSYMWDYTLPHSWWWGFPGTAAGSRPQEGSESSSKGQGDRSRPDTEDRLVCIGTYNSQTSILSPASLSHSCNKSWEPGLVQQRETLVGMVWVLTLSIKMGVVTCGTILRYSWWWGRPGTAEGSRQKEGSEAASRHS